MNSKDPRIDPCGTLLLTGRSRGVYLLILTYWYWLDRKLFINSIGILWIPQLFSFTRRTSWYTESNTFRKSRNSPSVYCLCSCFCLLRPRRWKFGSLAMYVAHTAWFCVQKMLHAGQVLCIRWSENCTIARGLDVTEKCIWYWHSGKQRRHLFACRSNCSFQTTARSRLLPFVCSIGTARHWGNVPNFNRMKCRSLCLAYPIAFNQCDASNLRSARRCTVSKKIKLRASLCWPVCRASTNMRINTA